MWANANFNAVGCNFVLWANSLVAYRPGTTSFAFITTGRFSSGADKVTLAAGTTPQAVRAETLTIAGSGGSGGLQPGDSLQILLARTADDAADTCVGALVIVGLDAAYQAQGALLPLVQR
jgi:hypothetical protein